MPVVGVLNRFDSAIRSLRPSWLFLGIAFINFILIAALVASVFVPRTARISVEAKTDIVTFRLPAETQGFAWGDIPVDPSSVAEAAPSCANPTANLHDPLVGPLRIVARSDADTGAFSVVFNRDDNSDVTTLRCANGETVGSGPFVRLIWSASKTRALTLRAVGEVMVGQSAVDGGEVSPLLHSGRIITEAASYPFGSSAFRSETSLFLGDAVWLYDDYPRRIQSLAHGILRVSGEQPEIELVVHADALEGRVLHEGEDSSKPGSVAPSLWAKLKAQSEWALLAAIAALLLNLLGALRNYRDELVSEPGPGMGLTNDRDRYE